MGLVTSSYKLDSIIILTQMYQSPFLQRMPSIYFDVGPLMIFTDAKTV